MGSHSGMTAEGDNKVLMQKVVKDILTHQRKGKHEMPYVKKSVLKTIQNLDDITSFNSLKTLIYAREAFEIKNITNRLKNLIFEEQKKFYDVWMFELNEEIQSLAESFGERYFL